MIAPDLEISPEAPMSDKVDKLVKEQQTNITKSIGKSYADRQPLAQKTVAAQDKLNDLLSTLGVGDFLEFMSKYAVDPTGGGYMRDVDQGTMTVKDHLGATKTVKKTGKELDLDSTKKSTTQSAITFGEYSTAAHKIAFGHFEKATDAGGKFRLVVETVQKAHSFPIYYLPWASNKMLRMTIPKKGAGGATLADPDIFFTAGINGCSVFIEGSRDNPTIYHAGTEDKMGGINSGKYWRDLYREYSATAASEPKGAKTYGEVKKNQYIVGEGKESDPKYKDTTRTGVDYEGWIKSNQKDIDVTIVQPWGCVFGLRTGSDWTFYLQKNAVVKYYAFKKSGLFGTGDRKRSGKEQTYNLPMQVLQVFPGHAHVRITDFVKVREGY
jgi:hypothetical protein